MKTPQRVRYLFIFAAVLDPMIKEVSTEPLINVILKIYKQGLIIILIQLRPL